MISIEISIEGEKITVQVKDARQAVSFVRGLYQKKEGTFPFSHPEITHSRKNGHVKKVTAEIFEILKDPDYNDLRENRPKSDPRKGGDEK